MRQITLKIEEKLESGYQVVPHFLDVEQVCNLVNVAINELAQTVGAYEFRLLTDRMQAQLDRLRSVERSAPALGRLQVEL